MPLRVLTEADLRPLVTMRDAIAAVAEGFRRLSAGEATVPVRTPVPAGAEGATLLVMPGSLGRGAALGAKLVTVFPANRERGRPVVQAVIVLVDPETGAPAAILDGEWLTALRTGAATGVATDLLARPDARVLAVIGAGAQAPAQIEAVRAVRPIEHVRIVSRRGTSARRLAETLSRAAEGAVDASALPDAAEAVRGADVVVTVTDSTKPVLPADAIGPGCHINAVGGYTPGMQELPGELVARCRVVVDERRAALAEAGDVIGPIEAGLLDASRLVEIGELLTGVAAARTSPDEITLFKSVGSAAQDLAVAALALDRATGGAS